MIRGPTSKARGSRSRGPLMGPQVNPDSKPIKCPGVKPHVISGNKGWKVRLWSLSCEDHFPHPLSLSLSDVISLLFSKQHRININLNSLPLSKRSNMVFYMNNTMNTKKVFMRNFPNFSNSLQNQNWLTYTLHGFSPSLWIQQPKSQIIKPESGSGSPPLEP